MIVAETLNTHNTQLIHHGFHGKPVEPHFTAMPS